MSLCVSATLKNGETALHMAASEGHVDVLSFLQDKGVNVNVKDKACLRMLLQL